MHFIFCGREQNVMKEMKSNRKKEKKKTEEKLTKAQGQPFIYRLEVNGKFNLLMFDCFYSAYNRVRSSY